MGWVLIEFRVRWLGSDELAELGKWDNGEVRLKGVRKGPGKGWPFTLILCLAKFIVRTDYIKWWNLLVLTAQSWQWWFFRNMSAVYLIILSKIEPFFSLYCSYHYVKKHSCIRTKTEREIRLIKTANLLVWGMEGDLWFILSDLYWYNIITRISRNQQEIGLQNRRLMSSAVSVCGVKSEGWWESSGSLLTTGTDAWLMPTGDVALLVEPVIWEAYALGPPFWGMQIGLSSTPFVKKTGIILKMLHICAFPRFFLCHCQSLSEFWEVGIERSNVYI